jgi:hypothetical protein
MRDDSTLASIAELCHCSVLKQRLHIPVSTGASTAPHESESVNLLLLTKEFGGSQFTYVTIVRSENCEAGIALNRGYNDCVYNDPKRIKKIIYHPLEDIVTY